jgi:hypothetical protein
MGQYGAASKGCEIGVVCVDDELVREGEQKRSRTCGREKGEGGFTKQGEKGGGEKPGNDRMAPCTQFCLSCLGRVRA